MSRKRNLELCGALLFLLGWLLILVHSTQSFWSGRNILHADTQTPAAIPITDLVGGSDFAFHQKSKSGDVPKVLPLNIDASQGAIVLLTKDWSDRYDMRWSPTLMQQDERRVTYAAGQRVLNPGAQPPRYIKRVISSPLGNFKESIYDLAPDQQYLVLLPQNASWRGETYSVEVRQRSADNHFLFLFAAFASLISGLLLMLSQRRRGLDELDPIKLARTYQTQGRVDEAREALERGLTLYPNRSIKIRKAIASLEADQLI